MKLTTEAALQWARNAAQGAGASPALAESLAQATVSAEWAGNHAVGFAHLLDYLDGLVLGRIARHPVPVVTYPTPASIRVDAQAGIAQLGFDQVAADMVSRCSTFGMVVLVLNNSFTVGELGYYTRRLAQSGLLALASANAAAQMTTVESGKPVFGTNPLSFAAPLPGGKPLVIDQASSATAFVNVRRAAETGEAIPTGWALGPDGLPTTDPREAVKGLLLPFGGMRGANIALMAEILSAGLGGGLWSTDAHAFASGAESPGVGLFVVAFAPELLCPGFSQRLAIHLDHLAQQGVRIPGSHIHITELDIPDATMARIAQYVRAT